MQKREIRKNKKNKQTTPDGWGWNGKIHIKVWKGKLNNLIFKVGYTIVNKQTSA